MAQVLWRSKLQFGPALCCGYAAACFCALRVPLGEGRRVGGLSWQWALGLASDGGFEVLGLWRGEGDELPRRIAADLNARGVERIDVLLADGGLSDVLAWFRPRLICAAGEGPLDAGGLAPHLQSAILRTGAAAQWLQARLQRSVLRHGPFESDAVAADFIAAALTRAERALQGEVSRLQLRDVPAAELAVAV